MEPLKLFSRPLSVLQVAIACFAISAAFGQSVEWPFVGEGDPLPILSKLLPTGIEDIPSHLYVCRGTYQGRWVPGKLIKSAIYYYYACNFADGSEHKYIVGDVNNVQVLVTPPGWTSWVPLTDRSTLPPETIVGGTHSSGEDAHVCRHTDDSGRIFPGKYSLNDGKCYYAFNGQKGGDTNLEVLVLNMFGQAMKARASTNSTKV